MNSSNKIDNGQLKTSNDVERLTRLLSSTASTIQKEKAIAALGEIWNQRAVEALLTIAAAPPDEKLGNIALEQLATHGKKNLDWLLLALKTSDPQILLTTIKVLDQVDPGWAGLPRTQEILHFIAQRYQVSGSVFLQKNLSKEPHNAPYLVHEVEAIFHKHGVPIVDAEKKARNLVSFEWFAYLLATETYYQAEGMKEECNMLINDKFTPDRHFTIHFEGEKPRGLEGMARNQAQWGGYEASEIIRKMDPVTFMPAELNARFLPDQAMAFRAQQQIKSLIDKAAAWTKNTINIDVARMQRVMNCVALALLPVLPIVFTSLILIGVHVDRQLRIPEDVFFELICLGSIALVLLLPAIIFWLSWIQMNRYEKGLLQKIIVEIVKDTQDDKYAFLFVARQIPEISGTHKKLVAMMEERWR